MPLFSLEERVAAMICALDAALKDKHLPGCYDRSLSVEKCLCGGPERFMLMEAFAFWCLEDRPLVTQEQAVGLDPR
jgi:hypothetical protein